ncbi:tetratricopeptide repeat protein [Virgisporangium ochraceum]|uniref:SARP family transcriptional regulator n=1 Tax=Virgisporangium ochraceum TaxID=65505 RepID=A0A8J4EEK8_9ACTN|nr:BTAD domain-containing putative transcriptional regulator [Virgisporangium ochraceum]GIJ71728.1 SARP family transcriptional regulator [Virgisporangium ochraceum]
MRFSIIGATALHIDGRSVPLGPLKQRALLALLLYHAGAPVRTDTIVEYLWDDRARIHHRPHLQSLISRLRAVLRRAGVGDPLVRLGTSDAYRLDVDRDLVDFHLFKSLVRSARRDADRGDHETAATDLSTALGLWHDVPVADLRGPLAEHLRRDMNQVHLEASKLLAGSLLATGRHEPAAAVLEPLLHEHDVDETVAALWISVLCAVGRNTDARVYYSEFRQRFRRTIRAEPSIDLPATMRRPAGGRAPDTAVPNQLPPDIPDHVGHEGVLAEIDALTGSGRVIAISGMPGGGKTSLLIRWAHRQRHRFDGVLFLDARAFGPTPPVPPEEALGRFLHALGVPADRIPDGIEDRHERLNSVLAGRRVLLLLDNVRDTDLVRALLPSGDTCLTLITSRSRLRGLTIRDGVRCVTVPPLPADACLAMLRALIGARRTDAEPEAVLRLVGISGGLPLALRIIGEHVAERPRARLADLADELRDHLLDLDEDDPDASLAATFNWSYVDLDPLCARLFRALGWYPGPSFGAGAAAAVLGVDAAAAQRLLNRLAKAHLVSHHDTARRYVVHDLLRQYAATCGRREDTPEEIRAAQRRLLDWILLSAANAASLLAPHRSPVPDLPAVTDVRPERFLATDALGGQEASESEALKWCMAERENLLAVTRLALREGFHRHGWQIPNAVHEIFNRSGDQSDTLESQRLAVAAARLDQHVFGEICSLNNLGAASFVRHDYAGAVTSFESGRKLAQTNGYRAAELICRHNCASVLRRTGNAAEAALVYEQGLAVCRELSNRQGEAEYLHGLADARDDLGSTDLAEALYAQSLAIWQDLGSQRGQGAVHSRLASLRLRTGRLEAALENCHKALEFHDRTHDEATRCDALTTRAEVHLRMGRIADARADAQQAFDVSAELSDSRRHCQTACVLADILTATDSGRIAAERIVGEALAVWREMAEPRPAGIGERLLALATELNVRVA